MQLFAPSLAFVDLDHLGAFVKDFCRFVEHGIRRLQPHAVLLQKKATADGDVDSCIDDKVYNHHRAMRLPLNHKPGKPNLTYDVALNAPAQRPLPSLDDQVKAALPHLQPPNTTLRHVPAHVLARHSANRKRKRDDAAAKVVPMLHVKQSDAASRRDEITAALISGRTVCTVLDETEQDHHTLIHRLVLALLDRAVPFADGYVRFHSEDDDAYEQQREQHRDQLDQRNIDRYIESSADVTRNGRGWAKPLYSRKQAMLAGAAALMAHNEHRKLVQMQVTRHDDERHQDIVVHKFFATPDAQSLYRFHSNEAASTINKLRDHIRSFRLYFDLDRYERLTDCVPTRAEQNRQIRALVAALLHQCALYHDATTTTTTTSTQPWPTSLVEETDYRIGAAVRPVHKGHGQWVLKWGLRVVVRRIHFADPAAMEAFVGGLARHLHASGDPRWLSPYDHQPILDTGPHRPTGGLRCFGTVKAGEPLSFLRPLCVDTDADHEYSSRQLPFRLWSQTLMQADAATDTPLLVL